MKFLSHLKNFFNETKPQLVGDRMDTSAAVHNRDIITDVDGKPVTAAATYAMQISKPII